MKSRFALCLVLLATAPAAAQRARPPRAADELKRAGTWALRLWKEALPVARGGAERAAALLARSRKERDEARAERKRLESELAALKERTEQATQKTEELSRRAEALRTEAAELKARLALIEDEGGTLKTAIDTAVLQRLPREMERVARDAERAQADRLRREAPALLGSLGREAAQEAVARLGEDPGTLERAALELGRRLAERKLSRAASAIAAALQVAARRPQAARGPLAKARRWLRAALPAVADLRAALERHLRRHARAAARMLLHASWRERRVPPVADTPATAPALAAAAGALRAAERVMGNEPPPEADARPHLSLAPIEDRIGAAAERAHAALARRIDAWSRALEGLERWGQEGGR